jgi:predicted AlkP superfamily phosphohydrolase/phosphomutase
MSRYGYLDMQEGWSDVSDERAMVPCVECGRRFEADVEQTWIDSGRTVAYCGCGELSDYRAEMRGGIGQ